MKNLILALTIQLLSFSSFAGLGPLVSEFLKSNLTIKSNQLQNEIEDQTLNSFEALFDWNLDLSTSSTQSKPLGLFSFQSQETNSSSFSATFSKYFQTGTEFSYTQNVTKLDLSKWTSTVPATLGDKPYSTFSQISVKQYLWADSFGRSFRTSYDMAKSLKEANKINLKLSDQLSLYEFISTYISAKKIKTLVRLARRAKVRAQKRKDLVSRKLKDGISKKIDLYQADLSLLAQKENIEVTLNTYLSSEESLSKKLQRLVTNKDVLEYNLVKLNLMKPILGSVDDSLSLKSLVKYKEVANLSYKSADYSHAPTVYMQGSLKTNTYNDAMGTAISDSYPGGDNSETVISLNMSIPLGMNSTSSAKKMKKAEFLKSELKLVNTKKELDLENLLIEKRLMIQGKNAKSATARLALAKKSLKEHNRLYKLGRIDLIQVLAAEDTVSNTEKSLATYLSGYELLVLKRAFIVGKISIFVQEFSE
jgi:outer membrane protein TolC